MRKLILTFLIILFAVITPVAFGFYSYAEGEEETTEEDDNIDYTGELDIITGNPKSEDGDDAATAETVVLSSGAVYDRKTDMYSYKTVGGSLNCSVADGMIVTDEVRLSVTGEFNMSVYRNGNKLESIPSTVTQAGTYVFITWTDNAEVQLLTFQIINEVTGELTQYIMPEGFSTTRILRDGTDVRNTYGSVDLKEEGYYEITYRCSANQKEYKLSMLIDHTPPEVVFEGVDEKGRAKGPVTITGLEEDDVVYVYFNDEEGKVEKSDVLKESGKYRVVVADKAGNYIEKSFKIMIYLNVKSVVLIAAIFAILIGLAIALYITRKRLRVR